MNRTIGDEEMIAERISRLGTETAFAVSAQAAAFAGQGNKVYPFHLGDLNIKTPDNIIEAATRAMRDGKTGYCPNAGIPQLREVLAAEVNAARGTNYAMGNVAIQTGGKPVIGKLVMALMNPGEEVLYPNPGYPIYESQIEFHGGKAVPYSYREGKDNFAPDVEAIESAVTSRTKLLVINDPQNPTGAECSPEDLERIADLAIRRNLFVLSDEAYFDMRYEGKSRSIASLPGMAERTVILYTFSKKFAMTGWRLGAAIGPKEIIDVIAKLNVNDESCSNHFVQYAGIEALTGDQSGPKRILEILKERRDTAVHALNAIEGVRCYRPKATFYLFPNITGAMTGKGFAEYGAFSTQLLHETGVSVCTRLHFGRPLPGERDYYVRLAYAGIDKGSIEEGLAKLKDFVERR